MAAAPVTASVADYLGGHLAIVRKTGTRHAAYCTDAVGPALGCPAPR